MPDTPVDELIDRIPDEGDLRERIARNLHERDLLKQMLRLAEKRKHLRSKQEDSSAS